VTTVPSGFVQDSTSCAGMRTPPLAIVWNRLVTCVGVTVKACPKVVV
jgi:hypothetical protein